MNVFLFDIDGTLIDAGGAGQEAMEASLAHEFGASGPVSGIHTAGRTDRAIAMDLFQFHGIDINDEHWNRYQQTYFRLLPNSLKTRSGVVLPGVERLLDRDDVARDAFGKVRSRLPAIDPDSIWVIGDTPSDIRCGRAIGAKVVAVATGMFRADELEPHRPDVLLNDLREADAWLLSVGLR